MASFSPQWLGLREPADRRARSIRVARAIGDAVVAPTPGANALSANAVLLLGAAFDGHPATQGSAAAATLPGGFSAQGYTNAYGINSLGHVVGYSATSNAGSATHAFYWPGCPGVDGAILRLAQTAP